DKGGNKDFKITITLQGLFQYAGNASREKLHVETFKELFPYARVMVSTLTTNAGMPPIMIPPIDMESQEIFRIDMPNLGKHDEQE
ncbi:MAG: protein-export chaperone SecB, partial [Clostridia bacterium]|nr:protein-export chaperone SecB [Clostridia bacterium]